ncbi:MAG: ATPase, T2SS/T4P/T4SS family [Candidatus Wallbacteria bacterium]|nr:ATPase, T2SS/T4P/T4SS family [Candidatus Wallbacteria bacterium]
MGSIRQERKLLINALRNANVLTEEDLQVINEEQKRTGESIGIVLLRLELIDEKDLIEFYDVHLHIPYANLDNYVIDPLFVKTIPENIARQYHLIALIKVKNNLTVAMADPLDSFVIDNLRDTTSCEIKPLVSKMSEIDEAIEKYYNMPVEVKKTEEELALGELKKLNDSITGFKFEGKNLDVFSTEEGSAPIVKLVNLIIMNAIAEKASDIHIEPNEKVVRVRYRVDGMLQEVMSLATELENSVVSRVKVMAAMDIAEKRVPQDGRVAIKSQNKEYDLRVSTFPTINGEKAVLRILDKSNKLIKMEELGFAPDLMKKYDVIIHKPNGIVLLTGPTGSGKSTTLYASVDRINALDKNIVTIEDPVEYKIPIVNQSQVNVKAGYTFAAGLRSILRQDPNVILVGEIRDYETAEISVRASLTGHLVFSTLHTNDASSAVTRLIDMGVEPFLVASSVICMMAQRLVRLICPDCKEEHSVSPKIIKKLGELVGKELPSNTKLYRGRGCKACKFSGYRGRNAIDELLIPDEKIRELVVYKSPASTIKIEARKKGMRTLREDGLLKVLDGRTTIEEVMRVTAMDEN